MLDKDDFATACREAYSDATDFTGLTDEEHAEVCQDFLRALIKVALPGSAAHAELLGLLLDIEEE